jgi:hypothetical protein
MLLVLALAGCCCPIDLGAKTPAASPAPGGTTAKPGHASGHILGPDGKPLSLKGATVRVRVSGLSAAGQNTGVSPPVDEQGAWDVELPPGNFSASASLEYDWKGKRYFYPLHPLQDDKVSRSSAAGFVMDFQWRIQGVRAGHTEDPTNHTHWHGSTLSMNFSFYREDLKKAVKQPPSGTKAIFTVTPTGPLIDGTEGKTLTFERPYDNLLPGLTNNNCCDIPVGTYRLTAVEVSRDGKTSPLLIQKAYAEFGDSLELTIGPGDHGFPSSRIIGFTRAVE